MRTIFVLTLWTTFLGDIFASNCTKPWESIYGNGCYIMVTKQLTWNEAKIDCQFQGSHLLTLDNAEEQKAVATYLKQKFHDSLNIWTDGTDFGREGDWYWDYNGHSVVYTDWRTGHDRKDYSRNCLTFGHYTHYRWEPDVCDFARFFICEK